MTTTVHEIDPMTVPVMLRRELLDEGWNDKSIRRMLTSGSWIRLRHGAYVETTTWRQLDDAGRHLATVQCVLKQSKTDVVVSHTSAAVLFGVPTWGLPLDDVHLTRTDGRIGRHEAGVQQHCGDIGEEDVVVHRGIRVMSPTRVALELTTQVSVEAAMGAVSHLLHHGLTTLAELEQRYRCPENPLVHWPGSGATDLVLRLAHPLLESIGEARSLYLMFHHHIPRPQLQHLVHDALGQLIGRVDFAWPELGVFVEFDGKVKYEKLLRAGERASDVVIREKKREDLICRVTGWRCLRITWKDLENPEKTAAMILDFLFPAKASV